MRQNRELIQSGKGYFTFLGCCFDCILPAYGFAATPPRVLSVLLVAFIDFCSDQFWRRDACLHASLVLIRLRGDTQPGTLSKELMLIVEVDGSIHELEEVRKNDVVRQKALEEAGFTVLRFTNEEVLTNIQWVSSYLEEWIEKKIASK